MTTARGRTLHVARTARGLRRDRRATTAVEFCLVAIPFLSVIFAILQVSLILFAQQVLETTGEKGARLLMTGNAQKAGLNATTFKTRVCATLPKFLSCRNLVIQVDAYTDFSSIDSTAPAITFDATGAPAALSYDPGGAGDIVVMKTMYVWRVETGLLGLKLANLPGNRRLLTSTQVFRTETF